MAIAGRSCANVPVIVRGTLQDPPVLTTPPPVVISSPVDRRWLAVRPPLVLSNPLVPVAVPATATPGPLVVTSPPPWPRTVQATVIRSTLADPPVLTTRGPVVTAAPADRRWFSTRPATVTGAPPAPVAPPASSPGLLMVMGM